MLPIGLTNTSSRRSTRSRAWSASSFAACEIVSLARKEVSSGYRKIALDIEFLRDVAELCSWRPANRSFVLYRSDERAEQDRFAGAVRANDRKRSPAGHGETEVREDRRVVEADREMTYFEDSTAKGRVLVG